MIIPSSKFAAVLCAAILAAGLSACQKKDMAAEGKGPAEKAGQQIDQATAKAGEKLNELAGKAGEGLQQAGSKMQEKASEAQKGDAGKDKDSASQPQK